TVLVNLCLAITTNIHFDTDLLIWAPMSSLKSPYVTFINEFNRPTWWTTHSITKRKQSLRELKLPKSVPFAVVCGACFQHSKSEPNLMIEITNHVAQSVPKRRRDSSLQYSVGLNKCIMTYMITEPIQKDGKITCTLSRGKQRITEEIFFDAIDVDIQQPAEELEISDSESPMALHCPASERAVTSDNPTINVWYEENKESEKESVGPAILSTSSVLYINQPPRTKTIVCAVYNIISPDNVYQTRYKIIGSQNKAETQHHKSADLLSYDTSEVPKIHFSGIILTIITVAAVVIALLGFMAIYKFIAAARRSSS
ncbi:hypothetical protein SK128_021728, partial [Halocaridina rubra]